MKNEKWKMENGKWKMENGKWKMENGKFRTYRNRKYYYNKLKSIIKTKNKFDIKTRIVNKVEYYK